MFDVLIVRNKCDLATEYTHWVGDGLMAFLKGKGYTVTDLSDADASPSNVSAALANTSKAAILLDHGSPGVFWGEENGNIAAVLNTSNVGSLACDLHIYTLACSTNANGGLGDTAVKNGCLSWLGYTEPVYATKTASFKACIWAYVEAMAAGKTLEQCEAALRTAYNSHYDESFIYKYNADRLLLRTSAIGMTVESHNREAHIVPLVWHTLFARSV